MKITNTKIIIASNEVCPFPCIQKGEHEHKRYDDKLGWDLSWMGWHYTDMHFGPVNGQPIERDGQE